MSVVVAKVTEKYITMASDSGCYCGGSIIPSKNMNISKMEKINGMILGGVGLAEENQLFFDYMRTHILDAVDAEHIRMFIKEFQHYKEELNLSKYLENEYLLAVKGKCYNIQGMFVAEVTDSWAIGAGGHYANGALYMGASAEKAVEAAINLCAYVDGKINVEVMEK